MSRNLLYVLGLPAALVAGPLVWAQLEQWWLAAPQDRCEFGDVSNARYQELQAEAFWSRLKRLDFLATDNAALGTEIDKLAAGAGLYDRIAATHAVMRAHGLILAKEHHSIDPPKHWTAPFTCDPSCGYFAAYVGPRFYQIPTLFLVASRKTYFADWAIRKRAYADPALARWADGFSDRTRVTSLTPSLKGPDEDLLVGRNVSCPPLPPAQWARDFNAFLSSAPPRGGTSAVKPRSATR